ncbi:MAG: hypothetical protein GF350_00580 [Chitinivibrionales bacterium]|nr:hypothetical protein [Chitinivibrionales bacterium]
MRGLPIFALLCLFHFTYFNAASAADGYEARGNSNAVLSYELLESSHAYNHPSSLEITRNNTHIAAAACGDSEGEGTRICVYRKPSGGSWSQVGHWAPSAGPGFDPVVFEPSDPDAPLILWYYGNCCEVQFMRISTDDGQTWSDEFETPAAPSGYPANYSDGRIEGPEQNPPMELPDGSLLCSNSLYNGSNNRSNMVTKIPKDYYMSPGLAGGTVAAQWSFVQPEGLGGSGAFLVFDPPAYQKLGLVIRPWAGPGKAHAQSEILFSSDGGDSWSSTSSLENRGAKMRAGNTALSIDEFGGPQQGWHLAA